MKKGTEKVRACACGLVLTSVLAVALLRFLPSKHRHGEATVAPDFDFGNLTWRKQLSHAFSTPAFSDLLAESAPAKQGAGFTFSLLSGGFPGSVNTTDARRLQGVVDGDSGRRLQAATTTTLTILPLFLQHRHVDIVYNFDVNYYVIYRVYVDINEQLH
eukprot:s3708_g2.t2